jgi:DNA repair protein RadC
MKTRTNPANIPAKLILDPLAPIPASMGKKDRMLLAELREAYTHSMRERVIGLMCRAPEEGADIVRGVLAGLAVESFVVVALNARLRVTAPPVIISRGDTDGVEAPIRAILRAVLVAEGTSFICAHNHPTGDAGASAADRAVTMRLVAAARAIDCPLNDHIIIGGSDFSSLRRDAPELWR